MNTPIARVAITALMFSAAGLVGLAFQEGWTDHAVIPVPGDVPTYGFGTTTRADGSPVRMGDKITPVRGLQAIARDVTKFEGALKTCVKVPLSQVEYDAFIQHAYNIGADGFCKSIIVKRLNAGDYRGACDAILMWRFVKGRDCSKQGSGCAGLWMRRRETYAQCIGPQS